MRVHSVVQPAPISRRRLPEAENYRVEARRRLGESADERTIELGALQLFENATRAGTRTGEARSQKFKLKRTLDSVAGYMASLSGGAVGAATVAALAGFSPSLLWDPGAEDSRLKVFGEPAVLDKVATELAPRFSVSFPDHEVWVTGNLLPEHREVIGGALAQLHACVGNEAFRNLKRVHVRPYLGQLGEKGGAIGGLASLTTPEALFVKTSQLDQEGEFADTLFHEFGHLQDGLKADLWSASYASLSPGTPFGNGGNFDFVSEYARSQPIEDLAETHSYLIKHWDQIQAEPQLWIHANGELGDKLSWILEKFYDRPVESLGQAMKQSLNDLNKGRTPFPNHEEFQEKLQQFLQGQPCQVTAEQQSFLDELRARKDTPARPWWKFW